MQALTPDVLARLRPLRLRTRRAADQFGHGGHASVHRGSGMEFAQYRAYEPGDDPRLVDWKLLARSDRYYVREAERESPLTAWVVLDASASMQQADAAHPQLRRWDVAVQLAQCAMQLALQGGDAFALVAANDIERLPVPAGRGPRHRDRCLLALREIAPRGTWPSAAVLRPLWNAIGPRALVLMISDAFDEGIVEACETFAAGGRDVCLLQVLMADERDFPYRGGHRFADPETGRDLLGDAASLRAGFLERFAQARAALQARCARAGIACVEHVADQPADAPFARLFGRGA